MAEPHVGGLISPAPPCYLSGSRRVVVGFGKSLRGYVFDPNPRASGAFIGHEAPVIAVVVVGNMRVASASQDGTVRVWGVDDGELLRTIDCACPLHDMKAVNDDRVVVATESEVSVLSLERKNDGPERVNVLTQLEKVPYRRVAASADASTIATIGKNHLTVAFLNGSRASVLVIEMINLTAVAISPDGRKLAVGDKKGYVFVFDKFYNMRVEDGGVHRTKKDILPKNSFATFHWHAHAVTSLCFSATAETLYSGGLEGVLTAWKLSKTDFGKKNHVPRLGGAIWGISLSENEDKIALTLANNSVRFIDRVGLSVTATIRGLSTAHLATLPPWDVAIRTPAAHRFIRMVSEPGNTGCALVSGIGNSVQLYDVLRGMNVADFQVVPRNIAMSGQDTQKVKSQMNIEEPSIRLIAISPDRKYMASVSSDIHPRSESLLCKEPVFVETLKFWEYQGSIGQNNLIAVLENPHGTKGKVTDIAFHPTLPLLASSSSCGTFKIWRGVCTDEEGDDQRMVWRCEAMEEYRGIPCGKLAFSTDGTVLTASFGNVITVWVVDDSADAYGIPYVKDKLIGLSSPVSLELTFMHTLVHPPKNEPVEHLSFVLQHSAFLLATTCHGLYIWDVLNQSIQWSLRLVNRPECTVSDPLSGRFALVVKFESDSLPMPIANDVVATAVMDEAFMSDVEEKPKTKKKRSKETPKRKRPKSSDVQVPSIPVDTAVAVFDVNSAVPKSVTMLPVGTDVAGIGFVGDDRVGKSLFCFDTNMEIVSVPHGDMGENISEITDIPESPAELNVIGDLVGSHVVKDDGEYAVPNDLPLSFVEKAPLRNLLRKYMDGSGVTQPIVTNIATPMLKDLSRIVHDAVTDGKERDMGEGDGNVSEEDEDAMEVDTSTSVERTVVKGSSRVDDSLSTFDLKEMSALFKTMTKSD